MKKKTHYRKVFKSDHLGVADLEEFIEDKKSLIFTIKEVKSEFNVMVAGRRGNHNIAYFKEGIKPLVLNATNSKIVKSFCKNSPFVEDWCECVVELYIQHNVKAVTGGTTDGVRIKKVQPKPKEKQFFNESNFEAAKKANAKIADIKKIYKITPEMETKYLEYVAKK